MYSLVSCVEHLIVVIGQEAKNAAWYYPDTVTERAENIKDHIAFCKLHYGFLVRFLMQIGIDKTKVEVKVE